jgi:amino acid transporter
LAGIRASLIPDWKAILMASSSNEASQKLSRSALIALVIGSMVGSGIFALPASFGRATGAFGAIIAWVIAGTGMLMLALVFQSLSQRKPDLDAGIYAYAKAGFGLKLAWQGETYNAGERARVKDGIRSAIATLYAAGMVYAGGPKFLLLSSILYAPGTLLFFLAKRERREAAFRPLEAVLFAAITIAATAGVHALAIGAISI